MIYYWINKVTCKITILSICCNLVVVFVFVAGYVVKSLKLKCDNCVNFVTKWTAPSSRARDDITLVSSKDRGGGSN